MTETSDWTSVRELALDLGRSDSAVRKRITTLLRDEPDHPQIRVVAGGPGRDRYEVGAALRAEWTSTTASSQTEQSRSGPDREELDHLRAANELLAQSVSHSAIASHHRELSIRDERIASLEAENDQLRTMMKQLLDTLGKS